jgi:beta-aspartyl-peptidase (threonine type)
VLNVLEDQVAAWNRGDLDGFLAGYVNSPDVTFFTGKSALRGFEPLRERYRTRYASEGKEMGRLDFSEIAIDVLGPDAAVARARWRVKMSAEELDGLFTVVLRRFPDGWRIVHDHTSG